MSEFSVMSYRQRNPLLTNKGSSFASFDLQQKMSSNKDSPLQIFSKVYQNLVSDYKKNQNKKLLMLDAFIVYALVSTIIQVLPILLSLSLWLITHILGCIYDFSWFFPIQFFFVWIFLPTWNVCTWRYLLAISRL
jgi:hypothetical protein